MTTVDRLRGNGDAGGHPGCDRGGHPWLRRVAAVLAVIGLVAGCGPIQVRSGTRPDVGALERSLKPGASTREEVRTALGDPSGHGRTLMPWHASPRTVWSYYYGEGVFTPGGESDDRRIFLFVFLDGDRYDGHLWFSSLR